MYKGVLSRVWCTDILEVLKKIKFYVFSLTKKRKGYLIFFFAVKKKINTLTLERKGGRGDRIILDSLSCLANNPMTSGKPQVFKHCEIMGVQG